MHFGFCCDVLVMLTTCYMSLQPLTALWCPPPGSPGTPGALRDPRVRSLSLRVGADACWEEGRPVLPPDAGVPLNAAYGALGGLAGWVRTRGVGAGTAARSGGFAPRRNGGDGAPRARLRGVCVLAGRLLSRLSRASGRVAAPEPVPLHLCGV